jgi:hypothetical protein
VAKQAPVLEVLLARETKGARLYVAAWCPPSIRLILDRQMSAVLTEFPDVSNLDRFMFAADAPYVARATSAGFEIEAHGRSAIVLGEWLEERLCTQQ